MSNFKNRTIFTGDNLPVLRNLNSDSVDLIYLDPPFNTRKQWRSPLGEGHGEFQDDWKLKDIDLEWHDELRARNRALHDVIQASRGAGGDATMWYMMMMAIRLLEMERVLKDTGSLYLHCDPTESHGLKLMMDTIFGRGNFRNEIVWCYSSGGASKTRFAAKHDVLLVYGKTDDVTFNTQRVPYTSAMSKDPKHQHKFHPDGKIMLDWWADIPFVNPMAKERTGYPTQKPLALLERIISAASNKDDVVLDPFCGCATAPVAAERLGRQWVGIDQSALAYTLVVKRLKREGVRDKVWHRTDVPHRTDLGSLPAPKTFKKELYGEQAGDCNGCGRHFELGDFHIDHIVPKAKGGTDHRSNLQLLCGRCNRLKGTGTMSELMVKLRMDD